MTEKTIIHTPDAPAAIGPYSQAVMAGPFLFVSGQLPLDPETGDLATDITDATHRCLQNIKAILADQGLTFADVVKNTVYLADMAEFDAFNQAYAVYFRGRAPARVTVGVDALPKGAKVEIECIALVRQTGTHSPLI